MNANGARPSASICVLTYNRCAMLQRLLVELCAFDTSEVETIVVDNHSTDGTDRVLAMSFPWVRCLRTDRNRGAAGRNVGIRAARAEVVVTLDDDVSGFDVAALQALLAMFASDPALGALNLRVTNEEGRTCNWVHHRRVEAYERRRFATYEITEGAVAFRKVAVERAGFYAEEFFLGHEGPDLAFRILELGYSVVYAGHICVRHAFAPESREPWRNYYYDTRNQFWLAVRNFPPAYAARYLGRGVPSTLVYAVRDGYLRHWLRAVRDAVAGLPNAFRQRRRLSERTMRLVREIDAMRPGVVYLARRRLFRHRSEQMRGTADETK